MKRSKTIKLVLVSSLLGSNIIASAGPGLLNSPTNLHFNSNAKKGFAAANIAPVGHCLDQDTSKNPGHGGSSAHVVTRGGLGAIGHQGAAS